LLGMIVEHGLAKQSGQAAAGIRRTGSGSFEIAVPRISSTLSPLSIAIFSGTAVKGSRTGGVMSWGKSLQRSTSATRSTMPAACAPRSIESFKVTSHPHSPDFNHNVNRTSGSSLRVRRETSIVPSQITSRRGEPHCRRWKRCSGLCSRTSD